MGVVYAPCYPCEKPFWFDADTVTSVPIDPETGLTPDLGGDPGRAVRRPVCPACCRLVNEHRRATGLPLVSEADTAPGLNRTDPKSEE